MNSIFIDNIFSNISIFDIKEKYILDVSVVTNDGFETTIPIADFNMLKHENINDYFLSIKILLDYSRLQEDIKNTYGEQITKFGLKDLI